MIGRLMSGRWLGMLLAVVVVLAVWKGNGASVANIVSTAWDAINTLASTLLDLWNRFIGSGEFQQVMNDPGVSAPTGTP